MLMNSSLFRKNCCLLAVLAFLGGCDRADYAVVDIPEPFLTLYDFPEGSWWTYQDAADSTQTDSMVVTYRTDCTQSVELLKGKHRIEDATITAMRMQSAREGSMLGQFEFWYGQIQRDKQWRLHGRENQVNSLIHLLTFDPGIGEYLLSDLDQVLRLDTLALPIGEILAYGVTMREVPAVAQPQYDPLAVLRKIWLRPGVGIVQLEMLDGRLWQLTAFELK